MAITRVFYAIELGPHNELLKFPTLGRYPNEQRGLLALALVSNKLGSVSFASFFGWAAPDVFRLRAATRQQYSLRFPSLASIEPCLRITKMMTKFIQILAPVVVMMGLQSVGHTKSLISKVERIPLVGNVVVVENSSGTNVLERFRSIARLYPDYPRPS